MKNLKLWVMSWPSGPAIVVEMIGERDDMPGYYYIRKPGGGTDTTKGTFLFDLPPQVTATDMTAV